MKKFLAAILALSLALCVAGCGGGTSPSGSSGSTYTVETLWQALNGAWVEGSGGAGNRFVSFAQGDDGVLVYSSGVLFSDTVRWGTPTALTAEGDALSLVISYPEVPGSEGFSGYPAEEKTYTLDISALGEKAITLNDLFADGPTRYAYKAPTLDEALAFRGYAGDILPDEGMTAADLWGNLAGVWVCRTPDGSLGFVHFTVEQDACYYTSGLLYSGAVEGGPVLAFSPIADGLLAVTVQYPAVLANEENDGHDAFVRTYTLNYAGRISGTIEIDDMFLTGTNAYAYSGSTLDEALENNPL